MAHKKAYYFVMGLCLIGALLTICIISYQFYNPSFDSFYNHMDKWASLASIYPQNSSKESIDTHTTVSLRSPGSLSNSQYNIPQNKSTLHNTPNISLLSNSTRIILSLSKIPNNIFITSPRGDYTYFNGKHDTCNPTNNSTHKWQYHVYNDSAMLSHLKAMYSPNILSGFTPSMVEKSDLWRYSIINEYGGLYLDSDAECLKPIIAFFASYHLNEYKNIPIRHLSSSLVLQNLISKYFDIDGTQIKIDIDMIIGIEFPHSVSSAHYHNLYIQFTQWAFLSAPHNPILHSVIESIIHKEKRYTDVIENTGPKVWSHAILEFIKAYAMDNTTLFDYGVIEQNGQLIPLQFEDEILWILILPYRAFGYFKGHSEAKGANLSQRLVMHHFAGSWK